MISKTLLKENYSLLKNIEFIGRREYLSSTPIFLMLSRFFGTAALSGSTLHASRFDRRTTFASFAFPLHSRTALAYTQTTLIYRGGCFLTLLATPLHHRQTRRQQKHQQQISTFVPFSFLHHLSLISRYGSITEEYVVIV